MRRTTLILLPVFCICVSGYAQGKRLSVCNSNIIFKEFNEKSLSFSGFAIGYNYLLNRFGVYADFNYYFPASYYGISNRSIPVNARGNATLWGVGASYDLLQSKSEKYYLSGITGIQFFNHQGKFNQEPFVRIYGYRRENININYPAFCTGIQFIYRLNHLPLFIQFRRNMPFGNFEYNDFLTSGFFEFNLGICFPIIKSLLPEKIEKITY